MVVPSAITFPWSRTSGWENSSRCQWWSSLFWIRRVTPEELHSLSKTTKLLLLDSLLQEVCIESGSDGSLALSSLGLSVCLVSHNLLYSGLKKAHLKMKTKSSFKMDDILCDDLLKLKPFWWQQKHLGMWVCSDMCESCYVAVCLSRYMIVRVALSCIGLARKKKGPPTMAAEAFLAGSDKSPQGTGGSLQLKKEVLCFDIHLQGLHEFLELL